MALCVRVRAYVCLGSFETKHFVQNLTAALAEQCRRKFSANLCSTRGRTGMLGTNDGLATQRCNASSKIECIADDPSVRTDRHLAAAAHLREQCTLCGDGEF